MPPQSSRSIDVADERRVADALEGVVDAVRADLLDRLDGVDVGARRR